MITIVTDSASMLPDELRARHDISVVPVTIGIDDDEYREGVDLAAIDFYHRLGEGATVTTAAPAPGAFVQAYEAAVASGAERILSIHTGSSYSATASSAALAATMVDVPVDVVDTGVASFPVALAVWAAAEALSHDRGVEQALAAAADTALSAGSLFTIGVPEAARLGGRLTGVGGDLTPFTILELARGELTVHSEAPDIDAAIDTMIGRVGSLARSQPIRVGVGHAMRAELAFEMFARLEAIGVDGDVVIYEVGPSVGAHTGPGTVGVVFAPIEVDRASAVAPT